MLSPTQRHSVTAFYEIKLHAGATGQLAAVFVRYENPDTHSVSEISENIFTTELKSTFEATSAQFQLAASIAEFAEILRESYWAQEGSLEAVQQTIEEIQLQISNEQVDELTHLVSQAISLKTRDAD